MELPNSLPSDAPAQPGRSAVRAGLIRLGYLRSMLLITAVSIALSLLATLAVQWLSQVPLAAWPRALAIAAAVPLLLAPVAAHAILALLFELERAYASARQSSIHDPLTRAYNRRFFMDRLLGECERARRSPQPLSLLLMDIDGFEPLQDRWGDAVGTQVLGAIVAACTEMLRPYDLMARREAAMFLFLLPDTGLEQACEAAERLRAAIANLRLERDRSASIRVTASFGVAQLLSEDADGGALILRADAALERAKASGRNRLAC
jgi:diguanylate cyclase (GGDEF)-like protein